MPDFIVSISESETTVWRFKIRENCSVICVGCEVTEDGKTASFGVNSLKRFNPPQPVIDEALLVFKRAVQFVAIDEDGTWHQQ